MPIQSRPEITMIQLIAPLVVALIYITLCSLFKEPNRRNFSALIIARAGALLNKLLIKQELELV